MRNVNDTDWMVNGDQINPEAARHPKERSDALQELVTQITSICSDYCANQRTTEKETNEADEEVPEIVLNLTTFEARDDGGNDVELEWLRDEQTEVLVNGIRYRADAPMFFADLLSFRLKSVLDNKH